MEGNIVYAVGLAAGLLTGVVAMVIVKLIRKNKGSKKYDERQMLARWKAYRAAFWTLVAYLCVNGIFSGTMGVVWADAMTGSFLGMFLAIMVYAVICIANDAYLPLKEKPGFYFWLFGIVMVANLAVVVVNYFDGITFITDGMLNYHSMNIAVTLVFGVLIIALAAKQIVEKKRAEAE